jgi:hypothetical protein
VTLTPNEAGVEQEPNPGTGSRKGNTNGTDPRSECEPLVGPARRQAVGADDQDGQNEQHPERGKGGCDTVRPADNPPVLDSGNVDDN